MDRRHQLVIAAAALLLAPGVFAQNYQVGQYMGNLNEAQRLSYYAAGSNAQAAYHAKYTPGAAYLGTANGVRMSGTAAANIGGRSVALTLTSRLPFNAIATAARGVAAMNPTVAAVTLLGALAMDHWLEQSKLKWNTDPADNVEKPFLKQLDGCGPQGCPQYNAWPSLLGWVFSPTQACNDYFTIANQNYEYKLTSAENGQCFYQTREKAGSAPFGGNFVQNYEVRYVQNVELQKYTWEQALPDLSSPTNYGAVDWKSITEQLLSKGGSIPQSDVRDQTVTGPASQPGQRTERTLSNGDKQVTQTTHNYTYNNSNVTHNTTTTTTVTNINNEVVSEETETTENKPPEREPEQDLCEKNPDILACQKLKLGELEPKAVPNEDRPLAITPDSGWGPGAASCPQPKTVTVMGTQLSFEYTLFCDFAVAIKPLFIGFAWLAATLTFFGIARRD